MKICFFVVVEIIVAVAGWMEKISTIFTNSSVCIVYESFMHASELIFLYESLLLLISGLPQAINASFLILLIFQP